jgi:hypothetical protein
MSRDRGKDLARFDALLSRHFVLTVGVLVGVLLVFYAAVLMVAGVSVDTAGKLIDSVFKIVAVLVGAAWALNRYYVGRTDALQMRVDPHIDVIEAGSFAPNSASGLLLYRLDVVNTGRRQLAAYRLSVEVASVELGPSNDPAYYELAAFPWHEGAPIEPGSWAAVSNAVAVTSEVKAVRILVIIETVGGEGWTWHQMFNVRS